MSKQQSIVGLLIGILTTLLVSPVVSASDADSLGGGASVSFEGSNWETSPTDPESPGEKVIPGGEIIKTEGPLRMDFIPKFSFGAQAISDKDTYYYADAQLFKGDTPARANFIQVSDTRGVGTGWQLSVKQETQFKNDKANNKELKGAILSFDKQWANSIHDKEYSPKIVKDAIKLTQIGTNYPIAIADPKKGVGTWTISFGSSGSVEGIENTLIPVLNADGKPLTDPNVENKPKYKNKAVSLFIPGKTVKDPVKYSTILTWTISSLD